MILEDQVFPKRCGHAAAKSVIPLDRYLRKLDCALSARRTSLVVVARTGASPIDEAIHRAREFQRGGADITLVDGLPSVGALKRVADEVPGPKVINLIHGGKTPLLPSDELHALGFRIVLYSTPALYAAVGTLLSTMSRLQTTRRLDAISEQSVTFRAFRSFIEDQYLGRCDHDALRAPAADGIRPDTRSGEHLRIDASGLRPPNR